MLTDNKCHIQNNVLTDTKHDIPNNVPIQSNGTEIINDVHVVS